MKKKETKTFIESHRTCALAKATPACIGSAHIESSTKI